MISNFDKEALMPLIKDLYTVIGIRISIFDENFNVVVEYPTTSPAICSLIRTTTNGKNACKKSDINACNVAKNLKKPHIYKCHAGITEAITPILLNDTILGYAIFAHMLPEEDYEESLNEITNTCLTYDLKKDDIYYAAKFLKPAKKDKIMASIRLLDIIASHLEFKKLVSEKKEELVFKIKQYIQHNLKNNLSSEVICKTFYLSRTKLYNLSIHAFNKGISEYITDKRIEKAKELLSKNSLPISKIAEAVGINDYNYFSKLFKKHTGNAPSYYTKNIQ